MRRTWLAGLERRAKPPEIVPACAALQTLGEEGDVDGAQAAAADAERLKVQRGMLEQQAQARANAKTGRNLHQKVRGLGCVAARHGAKLEGWRSCCKLTCGAGRQRGGGLIACHSAA